MLHFFNTRTGHIEPFKAMNDKEVLLYTCGPTVYSSLQIGNWDSFLRWDVLVRLLQARGYKVTRVMNITDVGHLVSDADDGEDKMQKGARKEGTTAWAIAEKYTNEFIEGMNTLGCTVPTYYTKATEFIDEQIELIKTLEEKGYTYVIDDGVYFDTSRFPRYADFARLKLEDNQEGARVEANLQKKSASDFALWKFSPVNKQRDMEWNSPWGKGFPGWHLECSAMALQKLGPTIDIHTGGIDHIPVHHTNEIAQSECATGVRFANYWLHNNHLLADGTKLSKSLGNSYTLNDVLAKGFSAADFRLFVLQSHYRSESNFTWQNLTAAQNRLRKWQAYASRRFQVIQPLHTDTISKDLKSNKSAVMQKQEEVAKKEATTYLKAFDNAMDNDMDTPNALAAVDNFLHIIDTHGMMSSIVPEFVKLLQNIADILGIDLFDEDISDVDKKAVQTREDYRAQKDWDKSDSIRHHLEEKGIYLTDTQHGVVWSRSKL